MRIEKIKYITIAFFVTAVLCLLPIFIVASMGTFIPEDQLKGSFLLGTVLSLIDFVKLENLIDIGVFMIVAGIIANTYKTYLLTKSKKLEIKIYPLGEG